MRNDPTDRARRGRSGAPDPHDTTGTSSARRPPCATAKATRRPPDNGSSKQQHGASSKTASTAPAWPPWCPTHGCPSAALLDEIARRPAAPPPPGRPSPRNSLATADDIAARLDPTVADAARTDALSLLGFMIGTLQLAKGAHRPRRIRPARHPWRGDGLEVARRPEMTASPRHTLRSTRPTAHCSPTSCRRPPECDRPDVSTASNGRRPSPQAEAPAGHRRRWAARSQG